MVKNDGGYFSPPDFEKKMNPQFNAPMVLYLCSKENQMSGMVFAMGAGWYGRSSMVSGKGFCIGNANREIEVEENSGKTLMRY